MGSGQLELQGRFGVVAADSKAALILFDPRKDPGSAGPYR